MGSDVQPSSGPILLGHAAQIPIPRSIGQGLVWALLKGGWLALAVLLSLGAAMLWSILQDRWVTETITRIFVVTSFAGFALGAVLTFWKWLVEACGQYRLLPDGVELRFLGRRKWYGWCDVTELQTSGRLALRVKGVFHAVPASGGFLNQYGALLRQAWRVNVTGSGRRIVPIIGNSLEEVVFGLLLVAVVLACVALVVVAVSSVSAWLTWTAVCVGMMISAVIARQRWRMILRAAYVTPAGLELRRAAGARHISWRDVRLVRRSSTAGQGRIELSSDAGTTRLGVRSTAFVHVSRLILRLCKHAYGVDEVSGEVIRPAQPLDEGVDVLERLAKRQARRHRRRAARMAATSLFCLVALAGILCVPWPSWERSDRIRLAVLLTISALAGVSRSLAEYRKAKVALACVPNAASARRLSHGPDGPPSSE